MLCRSKWQPILWYEDFQFFIVVSILSPSRFRAPRYSSRYDITLRRTVGTQQGTCHSLYAVGWSPWLTKFCRATSITLLNQFGSSRLTLETLTFLLLRYSFTELPRLAWSTVCRQAMVLKLEQESADMLRKSEYAAPAAIRHDGGYNELWRYYLIFPWRYTHPISPFFVHRIAIQLRMFNPNPIRTECVTVTASQECHQELHLVYGSYKW